MTTVGEALYKIALRLRPLVFGTATSGASISMADTNCIYSTNDHFNGGVLFITSGDAAGRALAITDYVGLTRTFSFADISPDGPVDAGDAYAAVTKYSRPALVAALNQALLELGPFDAKDETLTTVLDQESYSLPAGVSGVKRVQIATRTTSPYEWEGPYRYWREDAGTLYFDDARLPETAGLKIRLWYEGPAAALNLDSDELPEAVDADLVAVLAAIRVAEHRLAVAGSSDPEPMQLIQLLTPQFALLRAQRPVRRMRKDSRWPGVVSTEGY